MPCTKCGSDFNLFNWKIKCGECEDKYCNKCLKRKEGVLYCEKCLILLKRPPDRMKLMELKPKDLQDYLSKHNISTYGLVEKQELVDLFCNKHIPEKQRRGVEKFTANFAGPVPNLRPINDLLGNLESVIANEGRPGRPVPRPPPPTRPRAPQPPPVSPTHTQSPFTQPPTFTSQAPSTNPQPQATTSTTIPESHENTAPSKEEEKISGSPQQKYLNVEDFDSAKELQNLSSKELKILLTLNRVDFKGCVEKSELLERAERLWEDNNEQRKDMPENLPMQELCKLCMDAPLECVLLECGHIATCTDCGKKLAECPICRQYVVRVVRIFKA